MVRTTRTIEGVYPALITPIGSDGRIDHTTLGELVERAADAGVDGFAPCGSTGEGWHLSPAARSAVLRTVVLHATDGAPVICWVPANTLESTLQEIEQAAAAGATAALLAPPVSGTEQAEFLTAVAGRSPLPLVLYNIPAVSGVEVEREAVMRLAEHPHVLGIKDSTRDMETLQRWIWSTADAADFSVLTGTDTLLVTSVLTGAAGTIAASPGVLPRLAVDIFHAVTGDELDRAWALQRELAGIVDHCRSHPFPAGWKAALHLLGYGTGRTAPPREPLGERALADLGRQLRDVPAFAAAQRDAS